MTPNPNTPPISDTAGLMSLGQNTDYKFEYDASLLESFENQNPDRSYCVQIWAPEFTSLCPKTGQPDFAGIYVEYEPELRLVESKSFKLYLGSYRNCGTFHEDVVNHIARDLMALLEPRWLYVRGEFTPRGGIAFWPEAFCSGTQAIPSGFPRRRSPMG